MKKIDPHKLEKIAKVLRLARESPNAAERANAQALADRMMQEARIRVRLSDAPDESYTTRETPPLAPWQHRLHVLAAEHTGCVPYGDPDRRAHTPLVVAGRPDDLALYALLADHFERETRALPEGSDSFRQGVADTIERRMKAARTAARDKARAAWANGGDVERAITRAGSVTEVARWFRRSREYVVTGTVAPDRTATAPAERARGRAAGFTIPLTTAAPPGVTLVYAPASQGGAAGLGGAARRRALRGR